MTSYFIFYNLLIFIGQLWVFFYQKHFISKYRRYLFVRCNLCRGSFIKLSVRSFDIAPVVLFDCESASGGKRKKGIVCRYCSCCSCTRIELFYILYWLQAPIYRSTTAHYFLALGKTDSTQISTKSGLLINIIQFFKSFQRLKPGFFI